MIADDHWETFGWYADALGQIARMLSHSRTPCSVGAWKIVDENRESGTLRRLLSFYQVAKLDVPKISDARRKQMVAEFDEQWGSVPARLTEADIKSEMLDGMKWAYRLDSTKKH